MTQTPKRDPASERQVEAADPRASSWVSANAGSGKTRVLTDRVARLLLKGTPPQNVLCLTYTKAAASEMQNRLFTRLGTWSMAEDSELTRTLLELGAIDAPSATLLADARRLFARAIETPGGLKIQTIHSFCSSVLRRFPLEAGLSPGFREMDDPTTERLQALVMDQLATEQGALVSEVAALVSDADFGALCSAVCRLRGNVPTQPDWQGTLARFGLGPTDTPAALQSEALGTIDCSALHRASETVAGLSSSMDTLSARIREALAEVAPDRQFDLYCTAFLVADRSRPRSNLLTKAARSALGASAEQIDTLAERLAESVTAINAWRAARATHTFHRFATHFLPAYEKAKAERGLLDFDDLIERTDALLSTPGIAEWVLFRLDGGIDHVLVDEAQDTSPAQWRVIDRLTQEFTSGNSARAKGARTIFVVGDIKQSIYSFQGAEPESFLRMQRAFANRLGQVGLGLSALELEYSFRSAPEILRVVDETFPPENRAGLGESVRHQPFRTEMPGRVDLWPVIPPSDAGDDGAWYDPVDRISPEHHRALLARKVAAAAREMVDGGVLPDGNGGGRPISAGDILVLVQSRGTLFHETIRACKAVGLDVAGADVMKLTEELAVKDITAMLAFLDLPEDSLSLATVLRSPLCGWSEADLFDLAAGRQEEHLWASLRGRAAEFPKTYAQLSTLRDAADFLRPYELIEQILTVFGGREALVARLGPEATDGIDALLARALAYERSAVPSLTGFLAAQEGLAAQVKRQAEGRGDKLRVMTVHGAKGLEAPIVILPDTAPQRRLGQFTEKALLDGDGTALWSVRRDAAPDHLRQLRDSAIARRKEESRRLLYVAMTRAEQWLIVAAAGELGRDPTDCWYGQVEAGLRRAGAAPMPGGGWTLQDNPWPSASETTPRSARTVDRRRKPLPDWTRRPAATPARPAQTVAATDLGGAKALPGEEVSSAGDALARGIRIHTLLEHLPQHAPETWDDVAVAILAPEPCPPEDLAEVRAVVRNPETAPLFRSDALAEVSVSATLPFAGGPRLHGQIDRLVIAPETVLAVDFKSNRIVPETPQQVPEGLLRQMGAYRHALAEVYPDRRIACALLWTRTGTLMDLPSDLMASALSRAKLPGHGEVSIPPLDGLMMRS